MRRVIKKEPRRLTVRVPQGKKAQTFFGHKIRDEKSQKGSQSPTYAN